ncbi:MAG: copper-binding protein [Candidatus Acidiferrales bacterium]
MRHKVNSRTCVTDAIFLLVPAIFAFALAGCASPTQTKTEQQPQVQHYQLKGKVVSMNMSTSSIVVDMEAIPGYMGAMTMSYPVHGAVASLHAGDVITANLVLANDGAYLDNVQVTQKAQGKKTPDGS